MTTNFLRVQLHNGAHFLAKSVVAQGAYLLFPHPVIHKDQIERVSSCVASTASILRSNGPEVVSLTIAFDAVSAITLK